MIVLLDQDNVLADFEGAFREQWRARHPHVPPVEAHQREVFALKEEYPAEMLDEVRAIYRAPGFFRNLPLMPGALDGVRGLQAAGCEVYICTSPLHHYDNCVLEKFEWVERHLGREFTSRLILSRDKTLVHGDVLVDDNPAVTGVRTPTWRHVVYHQNYNRNVAGPRMTWQNWREVLLDEAPGSTSAKA